MKEDIKALTELIQQSALPTEIEEKDTGLKGMPFVIVPQGHTVASVHQYAPRPVRKTNLPVFVQPGSFCEYVKEQHTAASRLYVVSPTQLVCVIDHQGSDPEDASWCGHRATLNLSHSYEWTTWTGKNQQQFTQRNLAQFIEDNAEDVTNPEGAALLDLVRNIKASQAVECTGNVSEKPGNSATTFVIETKAKSGARGDLELPNEITLSLPVYDGADRRPIQARLRFNVEGGKLVLWYELVRVERFKRDALDHIVEQIATDVNLPAWFGTP